MTALWTLTVEGELLETSVIGVGFGLMQDAVMLLLIVASTSASPALAAPGTRDAAATGATRQWHGCSRHTRRTRHLQVSRLTCANAIGAIRRGKFALPPGGPVFSTPGYRCHSPVGPPLYRPRFTVCQRYTHAFRFYSFAEPV
jgi:hypothetical protein